MNSLISKNTIGVAIVGMGYMGTHHFRVLRQLEQHAAGCRVVGVCDLRQSRLDELKHKLKPKLDNVIRTTNPEELLSHNDVDAVYITTPWFNHVEVIRLAVEAGKHIYCEKPIAGHLDEIIETTEMINAAGLQAQAGLLLRHQPSLWKIKSIIDSGELGEVTFVSLREDSSMPKQGQVFQTDLKDRLDGRGILWEENVHDLDMLLCFLGDLKLVSADLRYHDALKDVEVASILKLETKKGAPVLFNSCWHEIEGRLAGRHLEVFFERGVILSDYFTSGDLIIQKSGDKQRVLKSHQLQKEYISSLALNDGLSNQREFPGTWYAKFADAGFISSLVNNQPVSPSFEDSFPVHRLIEEVYSMARS
jgi:predicted dehydrogenase